MALPYVHPVLRSYSARFLVHWHWQNKDCTNSPKPITCGNIIH